MHGLRWPLPHRRSGDAAAAPLPACRSRSGWAGRVPVPVRLRGRHPSDGTAAGGQCRDPSERGDRWSRCRPVRNGPSCMARRRFGWPGTPNFYVVPGRQPGCLWRQDPKRDAGSVRPAPAVQHRAGRPPDPSERHAGGTGQREAPASSSAEHLTPGDAKAARRPIAATMPGPKPFDGNCWSSAARRRHASLENRAVQPAVVKLRDRRGRSCSRCSWGRAVMRNWTACPEGVYRPEFAIGELWSRACNMFAAGMRARRMEESVSTLREARLVVRLRPGGDRDIRTRLRARLTVGPLRRGQLDRH